MQFPIRRFALSTALALGFGMARTPAAQAATLTVTNKNDSGAGSLRQTIASAAAGDTINFAPAVTGTITLTSGELSISKNLILSGPEAASLTVSGNNASRVFHISSGIVSISSLTITYGRALGSGFPAAGGGIYNDAGTLTVQNCILSGNSASGSDGGGIYNDGSTSGSASLTLQNCTLSGNTAYNGGGIYNDGYNGSASLTLQNCTLSGNSASGYGGGGIYNIGQVGSASLTLQNCTLSGNTAHNGGGIYNDGFSGSARLTLQNCTLSGNVSNAGGGIYNDGSGDCDDDSGHAILTLQNCTLSGNSGAGLVNDAGCGGIAVLMLGNTLLKRGASGGNLANGGAVTSQGYNLSDDAAGGDATTGPGGYLNASGDIRNTDPRLDPTGLKNNGGPTPTITVQVGSPAIDAGKDLSASHMDQRGWPRPHDIPAIANTPGGDGSDIGALEVQSGLFIEDVAVIEGNAGTVNAVFTVTRKGDSSGTASVNYATGNGTAIAGSDYASTSGTLTFTPGQISKTFAVVVKGDILDEPDETFKVTLSAAVNATILDSLGVGTITDDDPTPHFIISDVIVIEGNSGRLNANFTLSLSAASGRPLTVTYKTADGTATAGSDYIAWPSTTLTFLPGQTHKTITVLVQGDIADEANETFKVVLTGATFAAIVDNKGVGTITDDDPLPSLRISDAPVLSEGNAGTHNALFTISLNRASGRTVTVHYATSNGTATAGSDYTATSGTLTFSPGQISKTLPVQVMGDTAVEPNETFKANLSSATFAVISDSQGTHIITNDDVSD